MFMGQYVVISNINGFLLRCGRTMDKMVKWTMLVKCTILAMIDAPDTLAGIR
jgi:hypothetical protein